MKIEMICTGEEVLSGQIVDANGAWFSAVMMDEGIEIQRRTTVGDRLQDLIDVFQERSHHADIILVNGGIGPTSDDLSSEAMALAKNELLVENVIWRQRIETWFANNHREMPVSNLKQALLPQSAIMVDNPVGTACGFRVKLNRAWLFFTPGVPFEFKQMVFDEFLPFIKSEFKLDENGENQTQVEKLLTLGYGESSLQDKLNNLDLPDSITLGYRSFMPYIEIKIISRGNLDKTKRLNTIKSIKATLANTIVADNKTSLAAEIHCLLVKLGKTLSLAESCTGGMLTSQLVAFAGSSSYLKQGLVTYSNEAKMKILGVKEETLINHGAVSIATVEAMATGARQILDTDYALATSGIAGPDGGTKLKPVGTVAIALATRNGVFSQMIKLPHRSRELIRQISSAVAYDMLRRELNGEECIVDYESIGRHSLE